MATGPEKNNMKQIPLKKYIFMAICCDLGLFSKRLIAPAANIITDALHIPGGIGSSFSLMFLVVGAFCCDFFGAATAMGIVQSALALAFGMTGSMGALSPIGYLVPGIIIDLVIAVSKKCVIPRDIAFLLSNALGAAVASITANCIVFHLWGPPLWLYLCVALTSGALCGMIGSALLRKVLLAVRSPFCQ